MSEHSEAYKAFFKLTEYKKDRDCEKCIFRIKYDDKKYCAIGIVPIAFADGCPFEYLVENNLLGEVHKRITELEQEEQK